MMHLNTLLRTACLLLMCGVPGPWTSSAQIIIHRESFEAPPTPGTYSVYYEHSNDAQDYFTRVQDGFAVPSYTPQPSPASSHGSFYYIAEDTDDNCAGACDPASNGVMSITLPDIDVSGFVNIQVAIDLADSTGTLEFPDFIELQAKTNGAGRFNRVMSWRDNLLDDFAEDTNNDDTGNGRTIGTDFSNFVYAVGNPASVQVRVLVLVDGQGEEVGVDNIRLIGEAGFQVVNANPANGDFDAARNADIVIDFNGPPDISTLNTSNFMVRGLESGPFGGSFSVTGNVVTFSPDRLFAAGEQIEVSLSSGIMGNGGMSLLPWVGQFFAVAEGCTNFFFESAAQTFGNTDGYNAQIGDLDSDGDLDVVALDRAGGTRIWFNDGSGGFLAGTQTLVAFVARDLALGDLDGDDDL
ncbi:MAG: Ig-like domain-containing protein, partial [Verrucomicrobiota bacterium]